MPMYWMPVYGTGSLVGCSGSAPSMDWISISAQGFSLYLVLSYVDRRVPGGTLTQPNSRPTRLMYSLLVAHLRNSKAASFFRLENSMPSAHDHSQCAPCGVTAVGP